MVNYTEELFNAIKTISKKEVEALHFDTTIEVTVTDASRAHLGIYTVTNGSIYFTAYSKDTYKEKDRVLVMIPQGDYDQQKIIIGKKARGDADKPINYTEPFSQIIDVTNNLVLEKDIKEFGMVANGAEHKWENSDTSSFTGAENILNLTSLIWSAREYNDKFLEALESLNTILSEYRKENINQTYDNEYHNLINNYSPYDGEKFAWDDYFDDQYHFKGDENAIKSMREVILSSDNRFKEKKGLTRAGLRVDFKTLLKQFNTISGNYGLVLCIGFRDPDEYLNENNLLPSTVIQPFVFDSKDFFGNIYNFNAYYTQEVVFDISQYSNLNLSDIFLFAYQKNNFRDINNNLISSENRPNNIFINNYYICLGKDISEFNGDSLELYSLNETTFNKNSNTKEINLRWIHQDENSNIVKALDDDEIKELTNYEVRWYKYNINTSEIDSFAGARWERIKGESPPLSAYTLKADISKSSERILVIVVKNETELIAKSNILEFTNKNDVMSDQVIKDINALSIRYDDESQGNYFIYDSMQMAKNGEDEKIRKLTAVYAENIDKINNKPVLQDCESIKWIFPDSNSMIVPLDFNQNKIQFNNEANQSEVSNGDGLLDFTISHENNSYIITKNNLTNNSNIDRYTSIYYKIKKNLNFNFGRNIIYLEVVKNGQTYIASITMQFNIAGTSGSEYTLVINWNNQKNTFDIKQDEELSGDVLLLDPQGYEVELNFGANYEYGWYKFNGTEHLTISHSKDNNSHFLISKAGELDINELYILEVKLTGFGNYELVTRAPIPLTQLYANIDDQIFKVDQIEGPITVRYSADGALAFDKTPYNILLQKKNNQNQWENIEDASDVGYWKITPEDTSMAYLTQNSSATIDNIIDFFIENNDDTNNDYLRLLYRLIKETTDINAEQEFQHLENLQDLKIADIINALNSEDHEQTGSEQVLFFQDDQGYQKLQNIINKYKKCLNNNSNNSFLLLKLLQEITGNNNQPSYEKSNISTLSGILNLKNWENFLKDTQLLPVTFYASNADLYGVQYVYNEEITINGQKHKNIVLWTQPIYVYKNSYSSPTLNQWDGKLTIDNDNNTILAQGMSAGTKEKDNTFSGVMFGDWTKDSTATPLTGVYGFYHGQITYALKENGSAFFGNDNGKISLNDNNGINLLVEENNNRVEIKPGALIIQTREKATDQYQSLLEINKTNNKNIYLLQSHNFSDKNQTGVYFDLLQGQIKGYNFSLSSQSTINDINYGIFLSSGQQNSPLLRVSRENAEKNIDLITDTSFYYNTIEDKIKESQEFIQEYYTYYLDLISMFQWFQTYDKSFFKNEITEQESLQGKITDKEFYLQLLNYFNLDDDTIEKLHDKILNQAKNNNYNNLYNAETNSLISDWYSYWNFDEIPNGFLKLLTEEQIQKIKNILTPFVINNDINNISLLKNLFYPKIPKNILEDINYSNFIYNQICNKYNDLIYKIEKQGYLMDNSSLNFADKINLINQVNEEANKIIEIFQLNNMDYEYIYQKIINEETEKTISIGYINIFSGILGNINDTISGGLWHSTTGLFLQFPNATNKISSKGQFSKKKDILINNNSRNYYQLSVLVDPTSPFSLGYKENTNSYTYDFTSSSIYSDVFSNVVKQSKVAVDIYLFGNADDWGTVEKAEIQNQFELDYIHNIMIHCRTEKGVEGPPPGFWIGIKIKKSNSLIGKQKIQCIIQEKINKYKELLSKCQNLMYAQNVNSKIVLINEYYQKIQTTLNDGLIEKYNNNAIVKSKNNILFVQIPMNFNFRKNLYISTEEKEFYYFWDGESLQKCEDNNFIFIKKDTYQLNNNINYYIQLYSIESIKAYFYSYSNISIPSSNYDFHNEIDGRQFFTTPFYTINNLALSTLKNIEQMYNENNISDNISIDDTYIFDTKKWANDLINIDKNGGYLTSKNYRPTILSTDTILRKPTDYQNPGTDIGWSYGMKGMVIDLTNDRIVLGNNAEIQGFQTQYYPGQTNINHRSFVISTGAKFSGKTVEDREILGSDGKFFIIARDGSTTLSSGSAFRQVFAVNWDGIVTCRGITGFDGGTLKVQKNLTVNNNLSVANNLLVSGIFQFQNYTIKRYDYSTVNIVDKNGIVHTNVVTIQTSSTGQKQLLTAW